jgi:uncharacterized membrane protein
MTGISDSADFSDRIEVSSPPTVFTRYGVWFLLAILVFAGAIRLLRLTEGTLWLDESASWWFATQSWSYLWDVLPQYETNPPHYYMMLKAWTDLAGTGEIAMRIPSAIASTLVVYLMFVSGRILGGARNGWPLGLMAALVCAAWQFQIGHGANVRGYAFSSLGVALLLAGCLQLVVYSRESDGRAPYLFDGVAGNTKAFLAIAFGATMALMTHLLAVVSVGLMGAFLLAWWALRHRGDRRLLLSLVVTAALILAAYAPYLPKLLALVFGGVDDLSGIAFLDEPSFRWLIGLSSRAFGQRSFDIGDAQVLVDAVLISAGALGFWRIARPLGRDGLWVIALIAMLIAAFWLTLVAVTYLVQPVLMPRSLIFAQVPLLLVIAAAPWAVTAGRTAVTVAVAGFILIGAARSLDYKLPSVRTFDVMVETISGSDAPDAPVVILPYLLETGLLYYERKSGVVLNRQPYPISFELPNQPIPMLDAERVQSLVAGLAGEPTVWMLVKRPADYDPTGALYREMETAGYSQSVAVRSDELDVQETLYRFDRVTAP